MASKAIFHFLEDLHTTFPQDTTIALYVRRGESGVRVEPWQDFFQQNATQLNAGLTGLVQFQVGTIQGSGSAKKGLPPLDINQYIRSLYPDAQPVYDHILHIRGLLKPAVSTPADVTQLLSTFSGSTDAASPEYMQAMFADMLKEIIDEDAWSELQGRVTQLIHDKKIHVEKIPELIRRFVPNVDVSAMFPPHSS